MTSEALKALAERVERSIAPSNSLDMEVEIALFKPDSEHVAVRPNAAGTKLIYTANNGSEQTFWASDYTLNAENRASTVALLRAFQTQPDHLKGTR